MAAGKIVICTKIAIQGIDANSQIHYLQANKAAEFVKVVKWCLENKAEAEGIAKNAISLIHNKYEQHIIMENIINELDSILNL